MVRRIHRKGKGYSQTISQKVKESAGGRGIAIAMSWKAGSANAAAIRSIPRRVVQASERRRTCRIHAPRVFQGREAVRLRTASPASMTMGCEKEVGFFFADDTLSIGDRTDRPISSIAAGKRVFRIPNPATGDIGRSYGAVIAEYRKREKPILEAAR